MELKIIASDIGFGEGPVWHPDGFLCFSDVVNNQILKIENGKVEVLLQKSGLKTDPQPYHNDQIGANGLVIDKEGNLLMCQHGEHAIARLTKDGQVEKLVDSYQGKRLNSPNDLCLGPEGEIIFSDPPYGLKGQELLPELAQPHAGVYKWQNGTLELLILDMEFPNGVCFSHDYKYMFVGTNKAEERGIRKYKYDNGVLSDMEIFVDENADGIKMDKKGNLYLATMQGIKVISPEAEVIRKIETPSMATNLCLHEPYMYITTENVVYEYFLPNLAL
ncbi:MAG: SMP-30/gluconolactonase/LRE family protein [Opitutaceae bacterium]|nr:SMP-30/gluconolactonase/LRE family protein [Cytophagales bacterium]